MQCFPCLWPEKNILKTFKKLDLLNIKKTNIFTMIEWKVLVTFAKLNVLTFKKKHSGITFSQLNGNVSKTF